jgi:hypothetical protein
LCNFLHSPLTSFPLGANILLSTLFSNTHSLCATLNVRDDVLRPHKTTSRIMVSYILTLTFLDSRRENRKLWTLVFYLLLVPSCMQFWSVSVVPKYSATSSKDLFAVFMLCFCFAFW